MSWRALLLLACACAFLPAGEALAHGLSTPVLSLKEIEPGEFVVRWQQAPGFGSAEEAFAQLRPRFPEGCRLNPPQLSCGGAGLSGNLAFEGLGRANSVVILRLTWYDGTARAYTLTAASPEVRLVGGAAGALGWLSLAQTYLGIGIEHILLGVDHLLFVLGLMWLVTTPWGLIKTITAFTLAHSLSLAAATLGWLRVPEAPVNAVIALSIAFVAVELVRHRRGENGPSTRWPWAVAFGFGLLHGLGFAGALHELGLPRSDIPWALLFFNLGVEIGQVGFVVLVLLFSRSLRILSVRAPAWTELLPAYAVGTLAMFWFFDRMNRMFLLSI